MANKFDITGLILAGGEAQRMGGKDKGWQLYRGIPLVRYAVDALRPVCSQLVISANRNLEQYHVFTDCVVPDLEDTKGVGPLGGILAALQSIHSSHILVLPCDTPNISSAALQHLAEHAQTEPDKIHYLVTESGFQPLHAILPVAPVKESLAQYLTDTDRFGVMAFYRKIGCKEVHWENDAELENINHTEQLNP